MSFEQLLVLCAASWAGVCLLNAGFVWLHRPAGWALVKQYITTLMLLGIVSLVFVQPECSFFSWSTNNSGLYANLLTPVLMDGWRLCVLLACLLPALIFGLLLLTRPVAQTNSALSVFGFLLLVGCGFVTAVSLVWWLITFELLLLISLYLLRLTSKSDRIGEAVAEMFFWTLAGSICLLLAFCFLLCLGFTTLEQVYAAGGVTLPISLLLLVGFGVKLPLWPCFSWLLKAHVEASVEFSILLSGVVVKFGALGLYRVSQLQNDPLYTAVILGCGSLAILEATLRILTQRDLKRIVALTTIVEMNWIAVCVALGGAVLDQVAAFLLVAHSLTTTGEFLGVELVYRRFGTRDLASISGLAYITPNLFMLLFLTTLVTIGFPMSSLFTAKILFLTSLFQSTPGLCLIYSFWFLIVLPVAFFKVWLPVWFGQPSPTVSIYDVNSREAAIVLCTLMGAVLLGVSPFFILDGMA